jgi:hypothetical protein
MGAWIFFTMVFVIYLGLNYALKSERGWPGSKRFNDLIAPPAGDSASNFYKLMVAAVLVILTVYGIAVYNLSDTSNLGTFGDFVGGVVNPILTFLTFVGLLMTIVLQQKAAASADLAAQKTEATLSEQLVSQKRQSFEATFFQMLTLHNTIVNSMDIKRVSNPGFLDLHGRDCFKFFHNELLTYYNLHTGGARSELENIQIAFRSLWQERQQDLGHYFRYLYNIIRFTDEANVDHRYMKLLRAQLSDYELVIILYNSLTDAGQNFRRYIDKYDLMDNLSRDLLFDPGHEELLEKGALKERFRGVMRSSGRIVRRVLDKRSGDAKPE